VSQIHPALLSLTTCLARRSVPLKFPADAYRSPSIISNILWSKLYQHMRIRTVLPYHPTLGLDSRTPGICFGPYDDVMRTACSK
ncbi:hypothetical protein K443DRAFT_115459, partial [Laccaria amethystina LaAM-08-1]